MLKYNFILENDSKKNPGRKNPENVYLILNGGNNSFFQSHKSYDRIKISLKVKVEPKYFGSAPKYLYDQKIVRKNASSGKTTELSVIISQYENAIHELQLEYLAKKILPTKEQFKDDLKAKFNPNLVKKSVELKSKLFLTEYLEELISKSKSIKNKSDEYYLSDGRIKIYTTLLKHLKNFEFHINRKLRFNELSRSDIINFYEFINSYSKGETILSKNFFERKHKNSIYGTAQNTMAKYSKALLATLNRAKNEDDIDFNLNTYSKSLRIREVQSSKSEISLDEGILKKIYEINVEDRDMLLGRNYLLLSSLLGFRFEHFKYVEGKKYEYFSDGVSNFHFIESHSQKTNTTTCVPLFTPAREILDKYYYQKFPAIRSNSSINDCIKKFLLEYNFNDMVPIINNYFEIGEVKENKPLNQVISTHDGRSTFITNLVKLEVDFSIIAAITHPNYNDKKLGAFQTYNRTQPLEKAKIFHSHIVSKNLHSSLYNFKGAIS
jgi:hypothetical protein